MKKLIKRWLGIDKLERIAESCELDALLKYAKDEVSKTRDTIEKAVYAGKIIRLASLWSDGDYFRLDLDDTEPCYVSKRYVMNKGDYEYEVNMNYVYITGPVAEEYFKIVDNRHKIK